MPSTTPTTNGTKKCATGSAMILIPKPFRLTRSTGCSHLYAATPNLPRVSPVVTTTQACRKDTKQRLGLLEGRAEGRVLHGICPFHFVACFFGSCPKSVIGAEVVWFEQLDGGLARA